MLEKLGPLDADRIADLRPYLESVPDPRSRRGRWYSLTAILLVCACAAVCGAKSIDELAEFGERATNSLLASRRGTPSPARLAAQPQAGH
ncbi:transposase family protein, partial [Streptomyces acidiscabies]|uniref:transposase family protein n=1 Tax=Streptomyces acidiscabies TaxID=42234 RepID=UPI000288D0A3